MTVRAVPEALRTIATAWADSDPDPVTAAELRALIDADAGTELRERFERPLTFGTAGLRGLVGAGRGRMNRAVVIRTTRALAEHLLATERRARTAPVVVGFDARLSSRGFAEAACSVLAAAEIPVRYFQDPVPTPLVAYTLQALSGLAAIVVTASHNPAEYNGYKLYASNGAQIIPPTDSEIERRIGAVGPANAVPVAPKNPLIEPMSDEIADRYVADVLRATPRGPADRNFRIVYSPLHGVGGKLALRVLREAGFHDVEVVPEQAEPDGTFPTVCFPNPEEPGALDLALARAREAGADLVLVNDPDADRLAACVQARDGRWVALSGNQIGVLLADFLLGRHPPGPRPLVVQTIVSTPMTEAVARAHGARFEQTLTGFKWIMNAALELERREGVRFAFGFEEAIGFSVGGVVRDKDGIGAALAFAELAAMCRGQGRSVLEYLAELQRHHGLWVGLQRSVVRAGLDGVAEIQRAVDRLASAPPTSIAGMRVSGVTDYRFGKENRPPWLGATPLVVLELGPAGRTLIRPSGTEPKLKIYVDLRGDSPSGVEAETVLTAKAEDVVRELARIVGLG